VIGSRRTDIRTNSVPSRISSPLPHRVNKLFLSAIRLSRYENEEVKSRFENLYELAKSIKARIGADIPEKCLDEYGTWRIYEVPEARRNVPLRLAYEAEC